jgi:hypothetical protein
MRQLSYALHADEDNDEKQTTKAKNQFLAKTDHMPISRKLHIPYTNTVPSGDCYEGAENY